MLLWLGGNAGAQNAQAEALFEEGIQLMNSGDTVRACEAFEASNRVEPRAGTLIRLGECREKNLQIASAWSAYKDALTLVKDPRKRDVASAKAAELKPTLSYLTVVIPVEIQIAGLTVTRNGEPIDPLVWNRTLPADGGEYTIVASAPGHESWHTTKHVPIDRGKTIVEVPKLKEVGIPVQLSPPRIPPPDAAPPADQAESAPAPLGTFTRRRKIALGVAGVGVIGVAAGVTLGLIAKGQQSDAYKLCPDRAVACEQADRANALLKAGQSRALGANVSFGVAAIAAVCAGWLWFMGAPQDGAPDVSVVPAVAPGETGVAIMGRF